MVVTLGFMQPCLPLHIVFIICIDYGLIQFAQAWSSGFSFSSANKCLAKVAEFSAQLENYEKAIEIYEQVRLTVPF